MEAMTIQTDRTATRHPGDGAWPPTTMRGTVMLDDLQRRALVEQRMAERLADADGDRQARLAAATHPGAGVRTRIGRALIGLGTTIAGPTDEARRAHPVV